VGGKRSGGKPPGSGIRKRVAPVTAGKRRLHEMVGQPGDRRGRPLLVEAHRLPRRGLNLWKKKHAQKRHNTQKPMLKTQITISELIAELQEVMDRRGDLPVRISTNLETTVAICHIWDPPDEEAVFLIEDDPSSGD
jgi:hypothetical protein